MMNFFHKKSYTIDLWWGSDYAFKKPLFEKRKPIESEI